MSETSDADRLKWSVDYLRDVMLSPELRDGEVERDLWTAWSALNGALIRLGREEARIDARDNAEATV